MTLKKYFPRRLLNIYHFFLALAASWYFGFPSKKIHLIGITGTKGKTTVANYLYQILQKKYKVGLISTTGVIIGKDRLNIGPHTTTPSAFELQKIIKKAVDEKIDYLIVETSSHGFDQNRLWGLQFEIGIFTNIENDHLDYHLTWNNYAKAKAKLIKQVKKGGVVILNQDDKKSFSFLKKIANNCQKKIFTYGIDSQKVNFRAEIIKNSFKNIKFSVISTESKNENYILNTFGIFNLYNTLAALIAAKHLDISYKQSYDVFKKIVPPPGRMEEVQKTPFTILVDFAHNTYSLESALKNLSALKESQGRLITVFGCPGQRDNNRRKMGYVSGIYSNLTIITADDPRDEGVEKISLEIEAWAKKAKAVLLSKNVLPVKGHYYMKIGDRKEAIKFAIRIARKNDIVYITGMGDQHMMAVGDGEIQWNDKEEIVKILRK